MPLVQEEYTHVQRVGEHGVLSDLSSTDLPLNAFSDALNIKFTEAGAQRCHGYEEHQVFRNLPLSPCWLGKVYDHLVATDHHKVYAALGAVVGDITNIGGYYPAPNCDYRITMATLLGFAVFAHPMTQLQIWEPIGLGTPLKLYPGWPVTDFPKIIRAHKTFLFAMNIVRNGASYPNALRWSDTAQIGLIPTWDLTVVGTMAGENLLAETGSPIVDGISHGGNFVIFKQDQIWVAYFVGPPSYFQFKVINSSVGCLATDCVISTPSGLLFMSEHDIHRLEGSNAPSILKANTREYLDLMANSEHKEHSFAYFNKAEQEAWFCIPEGAAVWPTIALVYSLRTNTWARRTLPNVSIICDAPEGQ